LQQIDKTATEIPCKDVSVMLFEGKYHCRALTSSRQTPPRLLVTRTSTAVTIEKNAGEMTPPSLENENQFVVDNKFASINGSKRNDKDLSDTQKQAKPAPVELLRCPQRVLNKHDVESNLQKFSTGNGIEWNEPFLPNDSVTSFSSAFKSSSQLDEQQREEKNQNQIYTPPSAVTPSTPSGAPVLYSAIGSLENASANSFGKIRSQHEAFSARDFHKRRPEVKLICPGSNLAEELRVITNPILEEKKSDTPIISKHATIDKNENSAEESYMKYSIKSDGLKQGGGRSPVSSKVAEDGGKGKDEKSKVQRRRRRAKPVELFRPSCDAYTPRIGVGYPKSAKEIKYKPAESRTSHDIGSSMGTLSRPNFKDALRRVAMIIRQHVLKIEHRFEGGSAKNSGLFKASMMETFSQYRFCNPTYKCTMVRLPMARPGVIYGMRQVQSNFDKVPSEQEIYEFGHRLFQAVQLSSECSIVCLIYVERLMEVAKVPLVARTWRPIFMCGLLLASKVWQDLSSWNIEFASVYPQFSLDQINQLELLFLKNIQWDLYISSSLYAKYYFALRSLLEKRDFRNRYNHMVLGNASAENDQALKVQQRSEEVREKALLQLSRSM